MSAPEPAGFDWLPERACLRLRGRWTTLALAQACRDLDRFPATAGLPDPAGPLVIDGRQLTGLDTAGTLLLHRLARRLRREGREVRFTGLEARYRELLELVEEHLDAASGASLWSPPRPPGGLVRLGQSLCAMARQFYALLSFSGLTFLTLLGGLRHPARLRWRHLLAVVEQDGVRAIPVLGMLSFLLGVVIAYQAGVQLRIYGGNLYVVDLVTITVLRELGPLMTAIIVAGRSGSAYAAQIGTMQVTEEIDALRSIGVSPVELLVLPKALGLVVALPLLTMFSNLLAVFGGMVMAAGMLDVSFTAFVRRIPEAVSINSLLSGLGKAPVFALIIAAIGCHQGFQVRGTAESVGRGTTTSVVQAIVLVIVADAAFSIAYSALGI